MNKGIQAFHEYVMHDLFGDVPGITSKSMFGGYGIYKNGVIFAIITSGSELYFKVDDKLKKKFAKYDSRPFVYTGHKSRKPMEMSYWLLPEEVAEDRDKLMRWVDASVAVSKKR